MAGVYRVSSIMIIVARLANIVICVPGGFALKDGRGVDGTLAVDRLIVGEPLPWGRDLDREQPTPVSVRSVYKK